MNPINRLLSILMRPLWEHQIRQKGKRASRLLILYRDWPPDLVDTFLAWENARELDALFWKDAPLGYVHWKYGDVGRPMTYVQHLGSPREGVVVRHW